MDMDRCKTLIATFVASSYALERPQTKSGVERALATLSGDMESLAQLLVQLPPQDFPGGMEILRDGYSGPHSPLAWTNEQGLKDIHPLAKEAIWQALLRQPLISSTMLIQAKAILCTREMEKRIVSRRTSESIAPTPCCPRL